MIEREIPKEITDFEDKLAFGLSVRQIICVLAIALTCVPLYIFAKPYLGDDVTSILIIVIAVPVVMIGFFKYQGIHFEKIITRVCSQLFILPSKRKYKIRNCWQELEQEAEKEGDIKENTSLKPETERESESETEGSENNFKNDGDDESKLTPKEKKKRERDRKKAKALEEKKKKAETAKRRNAKSKLPKKKQTAGKGSIPRTSQESIPYIADYEHGLFEIAPGKYSKCFDFTDVNYQVARLDEQADIFQKWGDVLNYFDTHTQMSYTIYNKPVNVQSLLDEIYVKPIEGYEEDIKNFNKMLKKQFNLGRNDIRKEMYMTITLEAEDPYEAELKFGKVEMEVGKLMGRFGSRFKMQNTERRLGILHDLLRPDEIGRLADELDWDFIKLQGLSSKDYIAPFGMQFDTDRIVIDDRMCRAFYITNLPSKMTDDFMEKLTDFPMEMMVTVSSQAMDIDKAIDLVRKKITSMEQEKQEKQKKAVKAGYDPEMAINHELKYTMEEADKLLNNLQTQNQRMFHCVIGVLLFGKTKEELDENQGLVVAAVRGKLAQMQVMKWQQEDGFKHLLPLGHDCLPLKRTLTTESLGLFLPFTSQELNDKGGVYYSLNLVSGNMIRINRKTLNNPNGFILGESGSGKSFLVKKELLSTFFSLPDEQIYIIDPEAEYGDIVEKLHGQVIKIGVGSPNYINICDMDKNYASQGDPIAEKVDFLLSVCESMARGLSAAQQSIIDHVTGLIYQEYIQDYDPEKLPTFVDFYEKIMEQEEQDAKDLGLALRTYATGSLSIFAKKTNVDLHNRLICFDISALGSNLQNVGLLVVSELIWNKLCANRNKISTSIYIDEFHLMFKNKTSENFADQLYARVRKYGGKVTGITQSVDTLLQSEKARGMLGNSLFTCMLSQSDQNRKILEDMFSIGEDQLSYITNADKGHGLIRKGGTIVPFGDVFPKDNPLYRYMTTNPEELKEFMKQKNMDQTA